MTVRLALAAMWLGVASAQPVDFAKDVAPLLKARCIGCHGQAMQQSGLRLDSREALLSGGYSGPAIVPGKSGESKLFRLVTGAEGKTVMPPAGPRLTEAQVAILKNWIDQGAEWTVPLGGKPAAPKRTSLWSFQPIQPQTLPAVKNPGWVRNPIDRFILARLEAEGLAPSPEADARTLRRRVSLDLTGLPPSVEDLDLPYEAFVDRLLASPHYGEKWALHWLDQARYADSDGYEKDSRRPHAWRWREWVIRALNSDMPFDRFTVEQIAGDLLPNATVEQKVATGFHRNTPTNREGGVNIEMFRYEQVVDRASTVSSVWLGLTAGCAQCHDHKFDPISQKEFYQLFAYFNNADEANIEAPLPGEMGPYLAARDGYYAKRYELLKKHRVLELRPEWEKRSLEAADQPGKWTDWDIVFDTIQKMVDHGERILRTPVAKRTRHEEDAILDHMVKWYGQAVGNDKYKELKFKELEKELQDLKKGFPDLTQAQTLAERQDKRKSHVHIRGSWKETGIEVQPAIFSALPQPPQGAPADRRTLAEWLVSRENPLTSRVIVNRYWQELFGAGLVDTPADFGSQGHKPSHPELLDWLAAEFQNRNWSAKQMIRLIVTSAAYRQSSQARPDAFAKDANNRLLARQNAFRLPAETVRDQALAASGLLHPQIGGKSVEPYLPPSLMKMTFGSGGWVRWDESTGPDKYRRGLYIHRQRTMLYPLLVNFDAPNMTVTACQRERSNTPLQALNLLNDPVFMEMARAMANRVLTESSGAFPERLRYAYQLALSRPPTDYEAEKLLKLHQEQRRALEQDPKAAEALFPYEPREFSRAEGGAWVAVSRILFNLDEFLNRE